MIGLWISIAPSLIDKQKQPPRHGVVISDDEAPFTGGDMLALLQTKTCQFSERSDRPSVITSKKSLGAIFDDRKIVFLSQFHDLPHVTRIAKQMGYDNGPRPAAQT